MIRVASRALQGAEGAMLKMGGYSPHSGCQVRYVGPKKTVAMSLVVLGYDGKEESRRELGSSSSPDAKDLDHLAHAAIEKVPTTPPIWFLNARLASTAGGGIASRTTLPLDKWMPEGFGAITSDVPHASEDVPDDQPVTFARIQLTNGNRSKTVLIQLSLR